METPQSYALASKEIETIIQRMQSDQCEVDELQKLTTRAVQLLRYCKEQLNITDQQLKVLLQDLESI